MNMQQLEELDDRSNATAKASLRTQINRTARMHNSFKTQPFSAAC
jgi:hypothetical protein